MTRLRPGANGKIELTNIHKAFREMTPVVPWGTLTQTIILKILFFPKCPEVSPIGSC
jgi:hypothetical protein